MKVTVVADTMTRDYSMGELTGFDSDAANPADHLAEFAGRECYKSHHKPNPKTAANASYLGNILHQGHYSVLEHASVTFYVQGVSRALLLELERHRFLSFSVESQRYVNTEKAHPVPVVPPAFEELKDEDLQRDLNTLVVDHYEDSLILYAFTFKRLREEGYSVKQAREAARAFLPNCTPVDFVVTGNIRAWRDVLGKRHHTAADREIREFAGRILGHLREIAPNAVQDVPEEPYGA
ncbi:FAD-dependent thymidylate synthase [Streptomyces sp. NPDC056159]|uniref:FAD-dependent thymidylate synthase n=1 Tax=Streptomyces sp. NPDC056159 TaxID=3155537 RepID=UPI0034289F68